MRYGVNEKNGNLSVLFEDGFQGPPMDFDFVGMAEEKVLELYDISKPAA